MRGRDIKRYSYDWAGLWLIWIPWHFPLHLDPSIQGASAEAEQTFMDQYPSVYQHLLLYKPQLSARNKAETGIRYEWYALQRWGANYSDDFSQPKIVWGEISDRSKFAYEADRHFIPEATTFLMSGKNLPYLLCVLNSPLSEWFFSKLGTTTGVGTVRWKKYTIEELLIPKAGESVVKQIECMVDKYLNNECSVTELSSQSNYLLYKAVGLSQEEISYVENYYPPLL